MKQSIAQLVIISTMGIAALSAPTVLVEATEDSPENQSILQMTEAEMVELSTQEQLVHVIQLLEQSEMSTAQLLETFEANSTDIALLKEEKKVLSKELGLLSAETGDGDRNESFVSKLFSFLPVGSSQAEDRTEVIENELAQNAEDMKQLETTNLTLAAQLESKKYEMEQLKDVQETIIADAAVEKAEAEAEHLSDLFEENDETENDQKTEAAETDGKTDGKTADPLKAKQVTTVLDTASELEGTPYNYGGSTNEGFDSSGFVRYVYGQVGFELPATSGSQYAGMEKKTQTEAEPGDLIFFNQTGRIDHVGIYLGDGEFISAQTVSGVTVDSIEDGYWSNHVVGFANVNQ